MAEDTFEADLANDYEAALNRPVEQPDGGKRWPVLLFANTWGYRPNVMDVRTPPGPGPHPVVLYLHGGGWVFGHPSVLTRTLDEMQIADRLIAAGFAFATITYRLSKEAPFPAQLHDCKSAVRYLRQHAGALGIDQNRIAAMGESAGGHLAALLGLTGHNAALEGDIGTTGPSSAVQAVVDWYGPADFLTMNEQRPQSGKSEPDDLNSPENLLVGAAIRTAPDLAREASPISYVSEDAPPFLLQHGDQDRLVPVEQSRALAQALGAAGTDVELVEISGADHCFWHGDTDPIMPDVIRFLSRQLAN